jgi:murein DD-endopeptidase MepM/ murein hydrolase activator NlpD
MSTSVSRFGKFLCALLLCMTSGCSFLSASYPSLPLTTYVVKPGDTLYMIGRAYGVEADHIADVNDIDDPRELRIGRLLKVPYRRKPSASRSTVPVVKGNAGTPSQKVTAPKDKNTMVRVQLGSAQKYKGKLLWPVPGGEYTSAFGRRWLSFHEGIDISAPEGKPVYAAHDGVVVYSNNSLRGYGNVVIIKGDGILTVYGHNRKNKARVGRQVSKGDLIAEVGQSGKATGPHLHFETRVRDRDGKNMAVDPMAFFVK